MKNRSEIEAKIKTLENKIKSNVAFLNSIEVIPIVEAEEVDFESFIAEEEIKTLKWVLEIK